MAAHDDPQRGSTLEVKLRSAGATVHRPRPLRPEPDRAATTAIDDDALNLQLTPMLSFQQDLHYFWGLSDQRFRQAQFNAKLLGMVTTHFGLSIAFKDVYDSSMPPPVERNLRSLVSGIQLKF